MVRRSNYSETRTEARSHSHGDSRSQSHYGIVSSRSTEYATSSKYAVPYSSRELAKRKYSSESYISSSSRPHSSDRKPAYHIEKPTTGYVVQHPSRRSPERKRIKIVASSSSRNEKYRSRGHESHPVPPPPPLLSLKLPERRFIREHLALQTPSRREPSPPSRRVVSPLPRRLAPPPPRRLAPPPPRRLAPSPPRRIAPPPPRRVDVIVRRREDMHHRRDEVRRRVMLKPSSRTIIAGSGTSRARLAPRATPSTARLREGLTRRRPLDSSSYAIRKKRILRTDSKKLNVTKTRSAPAKVSSKTRLKEKAPAKREPSKARKEKSKEKEPPKPEKKVEEDAKNAKSKSDNETGDDKKSYMELKCPHCQFKTQTFRRYELHLLAKQHLLAMKQLGQKQKSTLSHMRAAQRTAQNELEKKNEDLTKKTTYCPLCQLNYKQKKSLHQASESHRKMKKFIMPLCKICNVAFKSPMAYEMHCCSIKHLKRKERVENASESEPSSAEEVDLKNFTLIDSIEEEEEDHEETKENILNVGIEQIQKIEIYHCNLCKLDLPREGNITENLTKHCKLRNHMKKYVKFKENQDLEKRAEQLQREELASKDGRTVIKTENNDELVIKAEEKDITEVEKDLASILVKAESDDDCQVNGERYDRFKLSENNDEEEEPVKVNGEPSKMEIDSNNGKI